MGSSPSRFTEAAPVTASPRNERGVASAPSPPGPVRSRSVDAPAHPLERRRIRGATRVPSLPCGNSAKHHGCAATSIAEVHWFVCTLHCLVCTVPAGDRMARMDSGGATSRFVLFVRGVDASDRPGSAERTRRTDRGLRFRGLGGRAGRRRSRRLPRNRPGRWRTGRRRRPRRHGPVGRTPHPRGAVPDPLPRHVNGPWRRLARGRSRDGVRGRRRSHDVAAGQRQADSEQRREHDQAPATEPARGRRSPDGHGAAGRYWQTCWV
jgi:hypothetical protein